MSWGQGDKNSHRGPLAEAAFVKAQSLDCDPEALRVRDWLTEALGSSQFLIRLR